MLLYYSRYSTYSTLCIVPNILNIPHSTHIITSSAAVFCGRHVDADTLPLLKQQQPLAWTWIFWSTAALRASGAGDCGALLHSAHQSWAGDSVVRRLEVEALKSTRLHSSLLYLKDYAGLDLRGEPVELECRSTAGNRARRCLPAYRMRTGCVPDAYRMRTGCVPDAYRMRTRCVPDAYRMRTRCVPNAYQMRTRCVPDAHQ